ETVSASAARAANFCRDMEQNPGLARQCVRQCICAAKGREAIAEGDESRGFRRDSGHAPIIFTNSFKPLATSLCQTARRVDGATVLIPCNVPHAFRQNQFLSKELYMKTTFNELLVLICICFVSACTTVNPYTGQQQTSNAVRYGAIGGVVC